MKKLIFCLFLVSCGAKVARPEVDAAPEMPNVDLPDVLEEPIPEVYPDASIGCDGAFPNGDGTGHETHPEHNHCH